MLGDLRKLIGAARDQTARAVNSSLVIMHWQIGRRIQQEILDEVRAEYGMMILQTLSVQLTAEYGRRFGRRHLEQMVRFAEICPDQQIVQTLTAQLNWSHFVELIPLEDSL